jgi:hypothetical protein
MYESGRKVLASGCVAVMTALDPSNETEFKEKFPKLEVAVQKANERWAGLSGTPHGRATPEESALVAMDLGRVGRLQPGISRLIHHEIVGHRRE